MGFFFFPQAYFYNSALYCIGIARFVKYTIGVWVCHYCIFSQYTFFTGPLFSFLASESLFVAL